MNLLILGGTGFIGPHFINAALARDHTVTVFHRGKTNAELDGVTHLIGDRDPDIAPGLTALEGKHFDAVLDTSGYVPRKVAATAAMNLAPHFTFISTISVYSAFKQPGADESAPLAVIDDTETETIDGRTYGPLKALCERVVFEQEPDALIIRPGLIAGSGDTTHRFPWWCALAHEINPMLGPGEPDAPLQQIDVRDLAEWTIRMIEARTSGVFNAVGPESTWSETIEACAQASPTRPSVKWLDAEQLTSAGIEPWKDLPLWFGSNTDTLGKMRINCDKAKGAGLTYRSVSDTAKATMEWVIENGLTTESLTAGTDSTRIKSLLD